MTEHLLLIGLGPIQDFINSARRCQDLWFGSWLLSDLSQVTATAVGSDRGEVIFPAGLAAAEEGRDRPGVANLILARLPAGVSVRELVRRARNIQQARLLEVADVAWRELAGPHFYRDVARAQLLELIEFLWVAVPIAHEGDYKRARECAYRRLAAIKNSRSWTQPPWTDDAGRGVPKSSLDGERESVISEQVFPNRRGPGALDKHERRRIFGLKGVERLCGVGLLKRLGVELDEDALSRRPPAFHSTSHVATTPLLDRIRCHPEGPEAARAYLSTLRHLGLNTDRFRLRERGDAPDLLGHDGSLLLESRLRDHFEQESEDFSARSPDEVEEILGSAAHALSALLRTAEHPAQPCPYYAFLLADGDQLGRTIDGIPTMAGHRDLADALNHFAETCRGIVAAHRGTLIFSGGDDVLALLPLHTAVACSRALAEKFSDLVRPVVAAHWQPGPRQTDADRPATTLSVGLGVSHCREAMSEARALAKRAEKRAKVARDSLAIVVNKRSGADREISGSWREDPVALDGRLEHWATILAEGELSSKAAHDIEQVALHYEGLSVEEQRLRLDEILSLLHQVLARKRARGGAENAAMAEEALLQFIGSCGADAVPAERVRALSTELLIARLFQQARNDAGSWGLTLAPEVRP